MSLCQQTVALFGIANFESLPLDLRLRSNLIKEKNIVKSNITPSALGHLQFWFISHQDGSERLPFAIMIS